MVKTDGSGAYATSQALTKGTWKLSVSWPGDSATLPDESPTFTATV